MQQLIHLQHPFAVIVMLGIPIMGWSERTLAEPPPTNLKSDEEILFFPTYGRLDDKAGVWRFDVHGKVFEPENSSTKRAAFIAVLRVSVGGSADVTDKQFLDERVRPFLVDNERGKSVTISIAGKQFQAGTSAPNGHFSESLTLDAESPGGTTKQSRVQPFEAVLRRGDRRTFIGHVHLIAPHGVSVISDIDDTIKHSQVTDKSQLLRNTFVRPFRAVEGMPELYAGLSESDVAFHYVSGSPWQLYQPLSDFLSDAGFPQGTVHLKQFRLTDSSLLELLGSQRKTKRNAIMPLLSTFPDRKFILVGDSGEQDPEIYGEIARQNPEQIVGIFIRNVKNEDRNDDRFSTAFQNLPGDRWVLFDDTSQIHEQVIQWVTSKR
jgi:phosphatidate phosphatase APP1